MGNRENGTVVYSFLSASFWMSFVISASYAAVFLQPYGYSNAEIGKILAAGCIAGTLLGPFLGSLCDRKRELRPIIPAVILLTMQICAMGCILVCKEKCMLMSAGYGAYIATALPVNTLNLKFCDEYERSDAKFDYGIARACGSLGFLALSLLLGLLVERTGIRVIPAAGILLAVLQIISHIMTERQLKRLCTGISPEKSSRDEASSLYGFIKANPRFCIMLAGVSMLFFAHNTDGNFLINITRNVGGDAGMMGVISAFTAIVEIPVMVFYARLERRFRTEDLLRFAYVFFVIKFIAFAAAGSTGTLLAARALQAPSYAVFTAAIVPYTASVIPAKDLTKGQSLAFTATTVGSIAASLISGGLYDRFGVRTTQWIAIAVAAAGALTAVCSVRPAEHGTTVLRGKY